MSSPDKMRGQIESITSDLIAAGLSVDQNFSSVRSYSGGIVAVGFAEMEDLSAL